MNGTIDLPDGTALALDEKGYLLEWASWVPEVAEVMAASDGIELAELHWTVIKLLRDYYRDYEIAPPMRALLRILKKKAGDDELSSRQLYRLFPQGPARQACRYAGLPLPVSCI